MKKYSLNENEIIDFIFDNKKIKKIDNTLFFNEKKIKKSRVYTEDGMVDKIKDGAGAVQSSGLDKLKSMAKTIAKSLVSFGAFRIICKQIAKALNKDLQTKRIAFNKIKAHYADSMVVTNFFLKSSYSMYLLKGYKEFYSWELAMACIMIFRSKEISQVWSEVRSFNVNKIEEIGDFRKKIDSKQLIINQTGTITDLESGTNIYKDKNKNNISDNNKSPQEDMTKLLEKIKWPPSNLLNFNTIQQSIQKAFQSEKELGKFNIIQKTLNKLIEKDTKITKEELNKALNMASTDLGITFSNFNLTSNGKKITLSSNITNNPIDDIDIKNISFEPSSNKQDVIKFIMLIVYFKTQDSDRSSIKDLIKAIIARYSK